MSSQRIIWIDYCKAIAIALVILLHVGIPNPYRTVVRAFIIPLFFFLSGLFASPTQYHSFSDFWHRKLRRLLLPYLIFNVITYIYWLIIARHMGADAHTLVPWWKPIVGAILGLEHWMLHCKPLWFLPCLMLTECLFFWCFKAIKANAKKLLIAVVLMTCGGFILSVMKLPPLPFAIGGALSMMIFYYAGYFVRSCNYLHLLNTHLPRWGAMRWVVLTVLAMGLCATLSTQTAEFRVFENTYGNLFFALPAAAVGCIGVMAFGIWLQRILPPLQPLLYIGRHTLTILALHLMVAGWIKAVTYYIFHLPMAIYDAIWAKLLFMIAIIIASIPLCYAYDWVKKRIA